MKKLIKDALKIALIYLVVGLLVIVIIDNQLHNFIHIREVDIIHSFFEFIFLVCTTLMLYVLISKSIIKQRSIEEKLRESEERYKLLSNLSKEGIVIHNKGTLLDINKAFCDIFGYKAEEIYGADVVEKFFTPESIRKIRLNINIEKTENIVVEGKKKDGTLIWVELKAENVIYNNQEVSYTVIRDISQKIEKDKKLRESEERFKSFMNYAPFYAYIKDSNLNHIYLSDKTTEFFEIASSTETSAKTVFSSEVYSRLEKADRKIINKESYYEEIEFEVFLNGKKRWLRDIKFPINLVDKSKLIGGFAIDISENKHTEKKIIEGRNRTLNILDGTNAGTWDWNIVSDELVVNERWAEIIGYKIKDLGTINGKTILNKICIDDLNTVKKSIEKVFKKELDYYDVSFRQKHKNGNWIWVNARGKVVEWSEEGKPLRMSGTHLDITQRKNFESNLLKSEKSLQALLNASIESALLCTLDGIVIIINDIAAERVNKKPDDLIGKNILDYFPKESGNLRKKMCKKVQQTKLSARFQDEINGNFFDTSIYPVFDENENVTAYSIFSKDITKQRIAEVALMESEEKYRLLVENGPTAFWIADKKGNIKYVSPNIRKMYGFTANEIYEKGQELWIDRIHKQDVGNLVTCFNSIFNDNKKFDITFRIKSKKGKWLWFHDIGEKYINESGDELAYGILFDISLIKQTDQKVLHAMINAEERERSRIAKDLHDGVSPVLSAIKLFIQSMNDSSDVEIKTELSEKINVTISEAIESIKEISNNISPHILQNFGLTKAVESFIDKYVGLKQLNISIKSEIEERLSIDIETALYRISTELVNNTFKYAKAKNLSIKYGTYENEVVMNYTDDGVGFNLDQVWKNKIGMGIFNIKNRISSLNGQFKVESKTGKGIKVEISVPINI